MKPPVEIFAIICENGRLFPDDGVFSEDFSQVAEVLEEIRSSGWECKCKDHRIVPYVPKVERA